MADDDNIFNAAASNSSLLTCSFNQDGSCLAVGTTSGFSVHTLQPDYALSLNRELSGGIGIVEMLFRCNLIALVGGGSSPHSPPHRVLIFDDHQNKAIGELCFRQVVLNVKMRKDAIAVALHDRIYIYHLADLKLLERIYTAENPHGLVSLSTQVHDNIVLACPSLTDGHVRVELYGSRKTVFMEAHEGSLRALELTADGSKLATASEKGTVLRVWDVATSTCLHEFRRGVERATITGLSWSWDQSFLCCTSDKGTAHVFSLEGVQEEQKSDSITQLIFTNVRKSVEGDTKKSVCQIRGVPHPQACTFVAAANNCVAISGWDADGNGVLLLAEFVPGQEPKRVGYHVISKSARADESQEARRRRRLRGWVPEIPQTPEGGRLYVGERLEVLEKGMEQIRFEEGKDDDEFVSVSTVPVHETPEPVEPPKIDEEPTRPSSTTPSTTNESKDTPSSTTSESKNTPEETDVNEEINHEEFSDTMQPEA